MKLRSRAIASVLGAFAILAAAPTSVSAHGPGSGLDGKEEVTMLQQTKLPHLAGKSASAFTVDYVPGQKSVPHLHTGFVIAYVLEGAVVSQLGGQQPVTYKKGESWIEMPGVDHLVSRNASETEPARLLVFLLDETGAPVLTPLKRAK